MAVSYLAKRRLLAQWEKYDRTGGNDLTLKSASGLVALSIPWDATVGMFTPEHNVLVGRSHPGAQRAP